MAQIAGIVLNFFPALFCQKSAATFLRGEKEEKDAGDEKKRGKGGGGRGGGKQTKNPAGEEGAELRLTAQSIKL